jgi:O-antigen/teichoic acid export membrane protein
MRNTVLLTVFEVANPFVSLILIGTMSRHLGAEGLGAYNLLLSFFFVAHAFTSLGLNTYVTREVSRDPRSASRYLSTASLMGILVAIATGLGFMALIPWTGYEPEVLRSSGLVALALIPSIIILQCEAIFIAFEKVHYIVYVAVVENVGRTLIGLWLLWAGYGVVALVASFALFRYVALILNLAMFRFGVGRLEWSWESARLKGMMKQIPVFGGILVASTLYWKADVLLLSKMVTLGALGYYTAASRLFNIAQVLPKSFNTSIFPVLSRMFLKSPEDYRKANSLAIRYILVVLLPIAAGIHGLAEPIVRMLFGKDFTPAAPVLKIIIWTLVPYGVVRVLASGMFASNRQATDLRVNLLGLATNILLNLLLIPRLGILGCAWATLLSIILFLVYQCLYLRREILPVLRQAEILRPALAASMISLWLLVTPGLNLAVRIGGGIAVYGLFLAWLQVISLRELRMVVPERLAFVLGREIEP